MAEMNRQPFLSPPVLFLSSSSQQQRSRALAEGDDAQVEQVLGVELSFFHYPSPLPSLSGPCTSPFFLPSARRTKIGAVDDERDVR